MTSNKTGKTGAVRSCVTPVFRTSFPDVFQARAAAEGQEPKFKITMLWPKTEDLTILKNCVKAALVEKYGPDTAKWPKGLRLPFRDGSEKDYDGYEGMVFASASSKTRPGVVDQNVQPITDPSEFYAGCYARAKVEAFCYDKAGNKGVALSLVNIQKVKDGEPFSGRTKPENDFDVIPTPGAEKAAGDAGAAPSDDTMSALGL